MFWNRWFFSILVLLLAVPRITAQPVINDGGVVNAASYAFVGLPNSAIAQGSMFLVFGTGLGPASLEKVKSFPIPKELGGTSVKITVNGTTVDGRMVYALAGQIAVILPSNTPVGSGTITVTYNGATSDPRPIEVASSSFGTFARNQGGSGPGVITDAHYQMFDMTRAAMPGDPAILWGTGLGAVTFGDAQPPQAKDLTNIPVEVFVGEKTAKLYYRGRSGCCSALDQIVFYVPSGVEGCHVPVVVKINNVVSNTTTMPVTSASDRVCSDTGGMSSADLQSLLGKPAFSLGVLPLVRNSVSFSMPGMSIDSTTDEGSAEFGRYTSAQFAASQGMFQTVSIGSCIVWQYSGNATAIDPIQPKWLDAGPFIEVNGPNGMKQLPRTADGTYMAKLGGGSTPGSPPLYLDAGLYSANNGSGGADIGGFKVSFNVPHPLTWTNKASITDVDRAAGLTVTWSGGDTSAIAVISGVSSTMGDHPVGAMFSCRAPVSAMTFTVPPMVLLALPPSGDAGGVPMGFLDVGSMTTPVKFTAPNLDLAYALSLVESSKGVNYK